jgi:phosphoribosylformimino-5-aminoimidazole carboxamide ribotide isomerase
MAKRFEDAGCRRLHLVDLDGARAKHIINHSTLERIATRTHLIIDFGGGVKTDHDIHIAFDSGAQMITGGSIAVKSPDTMLRWLTTYGPESIILGADARNGKIMVEGWQSGSDTDIADFVGYFHDNGARKVISTDIAVDGMLTGPSIDMYTALLDRYPDIELIASGGVSSMADIDALNAHNLSGVIVGKAIYEHRITLNEITNHNLSCY